MEHIKRVGRELMYKGSMLEFYKDTIVTPDGKTVYWDHIEHTLSFNTPGCSLVSRTILAEPRTVCATNL